MKFTVLNTEESAQLTDIRTDCWYQCKVKESIRVEPFAEDSRANFANMALCLLMHNSKYDEYSSYAITFFIAPESKDSRMYDIIRSMSGTRTNFSKIKTLDIETDVFVGKIFSIKFREEHGKVKVFLYGYVKPEKRFLFDDKKYIRPPWVTRKMYYKTTATTTADTEDGIVLVSELEANDGADVKMSELLSDVIKVKGIEAEEVKEEVKEIEEVGIEEVVVEEVEIEEVEIEEVGIEEVVAEEKETKVDDTETKVDDIDLSDVDIIGML